MKVSVGRWVILISVIICVQGSVRSPRAVKQFSSMIRARTLLSLSDLNGYGNFCGLKGSGVPVDNIDKCCQTHDNCLKISNREFCKPLRYFSFFVVPYQWQYIVSSQFNIIACSGRNGRCKQALCQCDKAAAECWAKYQHQYNPAFKKKKRFGLF